MGALHQLVGCVETVIEKYYIQAEIDTAREKSNVESCVGVAGWYSWLLLVSRCWADHTAQTKKQSWLVLLLTVLVEHVQSCREWGKLL